MAQFEKVYIEISDYCALSCGFCPSNTLDKRRGIMDLAFFESICAQFQHKTKRVCLHILGDPLSVKDFNSYVKISHSYGLKIDLVTTGLFLKERDFEILLHEPFVQISFSLSAFLANPQQLTMKHLRRILTLCERHIQKNANPFINLRFHQNDVKQGSEGFNVMIEAISAFFGISFFEIQHKLSAGNRIRLARKILLNPTISFEWEQDCIKEKNIQHLPNKKPLCYGTLKQCGVLSNGELVPCCIDYAGRASFGNVKERSVKEILESKAFVDFGTLLKNGVAPCEICCKCGYKMILEDS